MQALQKFDYIPFFCLFGLHTRTHIWEILSCHWGEYSKPLLASIKLLKIYITCVIILCLEAFCTSRSKVIRCIHINIDRQYDLYVDLILSGGIPYSPPPVPYWKENSHWKRERTKIKIRNFLLSTGWPFPPIKSYIGHFKKSMP